MKCRENIERRALYCALYGSTWVQQLFSRQQLEFYFLFLASGSQIISALQYRMLKIILGIQNVHSSPTPLHTICHEFLSLLLFGLMNS